MPTRDEARRITSNIAKLPADAEAASATLKKHVVSLPEPSKEEAARDFLIVAEEKYARCRATKAEAETAAKRAETAVKVFAQYGAVSTAVLEGIYDSVEKEFTEYYTFINRDDEERFAGKLTPSVGKLAFDVDFYGRGKFPPGAYHSEGHQDGMGLLACTRFRRHRVRCFDGTGGGSWRGGSLHASSSLRRCG